MTDIDNQVPGPVDYLLVEWTGGRPHGEVAPHLIDLVERGLIRILDLRFLTKDEDGNITEIEITDLGDEVVEYAVFEGARSGIVDEDDLASAADVLEPGTAAALLVYENAWAAPLAGAVLRSGGEVVASGRIPVPDLLAAIDAAEANS
jgi:hypothetical protein